MRRKIIVASILFLFAIESACGPQATPAPATQTVSTSSQCTDSASFVADVTVPDGTHFDKGESFTKTWTIKNVGTCTWTPRYTLVYSSGQAMDTGTAIPLKETKPNSTIDISVKLTAPDQDGAFTSNFHILDAGGRPVEVDKGTDIWVKIAVGTYTAPPTAEPFSELASCDFSLNADYTNELLTLVNNARSANGLSSLTLNAKLSAAAQAHSADMACNSLLSHSGSKGSSVQSRLSAQGYSPSFEVENIYAQPPNFGGTPQAALDWWMADAEHRAAILDSRATEIGIGYSFVQTSELGGYFAIDLAAP